jgi:hypothetical protein
MLSSPVTYRFQYEAAVTRGYYGQLLGKWDKREALGADCQHAAASQLHQLTTRTAFPHGFMLTPLIQLPMV